MRRSLCLALTLAACGPTTSDGGATTSGDETRDVASNQNAPPPEPWVPPGGEAPSTTPSPAGSPPRGSGATPESAVTLCGPEESYLFVAEHRCPDGSQPLGGDPALGRQARLGNVGANASGHIIDHYRVRCGADDVDIFVDMYGCREMQNLFGGP